MRKLRWRSGYGQLALRREVSRSNHSRRQLFTETDYTIKKIQIQIHMKNHTFWTFKKKIAHWPNCKILIYHHNTLYRVLLLCIFIFISQHLFFLRKIFIFFSIFTFSFFDFSIEEKKNFSWYSCKSEFFFQKHFLFWNVFSLNEWEFENFIANIFLP